MPTQLPCRGRASDLQILSVLGDEKLANSWWEIRVLADPSQEDSIFWRLQHFGCKGTATEVKGKSYLTIGYLPEERASLLDLAALSLWLRQDALCADFPVPTTQWRLIDEEDWASGWKDHWKPTEIGDRILVYPAWLTVPENPERAVLRLDPGVAFGTGAHPTTQLCVESLEMRFHPDSEPTIVADIGCGSGILSIAAVLLGAQLVYAVDIDPLAIRATGANRDLNDISDQQLVVTRGGLEQVLKVAPAPVGGFVCNISAEVSIDLIPHFEAIAKPTAWGVLSGILLEQAKPIADALEQHGWLVATLWKRQEWCCFNIRRAEEY